MINQKGLYELYRQRTGKSMYGGDALRVSEIELIPRQVWQAAKVQEYRFTVGGDA